MPIASRENNRGRVDSLKAGTVFCKQRHYWWLIVASLQFTVLLSPISCLNSYTHNRRVELIQCHFDFVRTEFLWKSLSLQQNFVAATSRTNSVWFDFLRLVAVVKFCCGDKFSQKFSSTHEAICRCDVSLTVLLQLVARPVHMEWSVAATSCCNLSPEKQA